MVESDIAKGLGMLKASELIINILCMISVECVVILIFCILARNSIEVLNPVDLKIHQPPFSGTFDLRKYLIFKFDFFGAHL